MTTNTDAVPLTDEQIQALKAAALAATPQNIDSAEIIEHSIGSGEQIECPHCGGDGSVPLEADYCNYDGEALGVQFYGIGNAHGLAEQYFRAAKPATVIGLIERLERAEAALLSASKPAVLQDNEQDPDVELCRHCGEPADRPGFCVCNGAKYERKHRAASPAAPAQSAPTDEQIRRAMILTPAYSDDADYAHWIRMGRAVLAIAAQPASGGAE